MQRSSAPTAAVSQLPWDDLRLFLALCRSPKLGTAARQLGVDVSTVSRRLTALEEVLQATLFDRGRSGIRATAFAQALLPVAEEIEAGVARFAGVAETFEREVQGTVRVACPPDAADVLVAPLLPELVRAHPRLRIELAASESIVDLTQREADIALRIRRPTSGDLVVTRLFPVRWTPCASPALAASLGTLRHWGDAPWIGYADALGGLPGARWQRAVVPDEAVRLHVDSIRTMLTMIASGGGVGVVPEPSRVGLGLAELALGRAPKRDAASLPEDALFLVGHAALRNVPRVRVVWEFLREHAGRPPRAPVR